MSNIHFQMYDCLYRLWLLSARKHHPDRAGNDNDDHFILARKAYETLSDPVKRYAYDRWLTVVKEENVELIPIFNKVRSQNITMESRIGQGVYPFWSPELNRFLYRLWWHYVDFGSQVSSSTAILKCTILTRSAVLGKGRSGSYVGPAVLLLVL